MIVQNVSEDGRTTDITFTVPTADFERSIAKIEGLKDTVVMEKVSGSSDVAKVSVIGIGMRSHAGVAAAAFRALAAARHQHPAHHHLGDQDFHPDRRRLYRACGAHAPFNIRTRQDVGEARQGCRRPGGRVPPSGAGADEGRSFECGARPDATARGGAARRTALAATRGALAGPRVLLRKLREVMAEPIGAQQRLDKIVTLIAANMVAEVCSVYVLRADNVLELYATEGLKAGAVHHATLQVGRGLVGLIAAEARPLNLPDAQSHPAFAYLPETGEEVYHSFLGVPVLRAGRTLGVLVVQNRSYRSYAEEELEALQTTAMVLAEMFASGEMEDLDDPRRRPRRRTGRCISRASGSPRGSRSAMSCCTSRASSSRSSSPRTSSSSCGGSTRRWRASGSPSTISWRAAPRSGAGEHREILEAYKMFAEDRGWTRRLQEAIAQRPDRRGGGRARAERHARADGAADRSVPARPPARFR